MRLGASSMLRRVACNLQLFGLLFLLAPAPGLVAQNSAGTQNTAAAQNNETPTVRRDAVVVLRPADATSVARTARPLTPSDKLRAPFPPKQPGCAHLVDNVWQPVPCATPEYMKAHYMPPPVLANSIQSTAHNGPILFTGTKPPYLPGKIESITSPFTWGSVAVNVTSDPATATEESGGNANTFSIQTNTNTFKCAPCANGSPFAATAGIPNSASKPGDTGWVQFVYQQFATGPVGKGNSRLCVWNVDINIANATSNAAGYAPTCVYPSASETVAGLDGKGAAIGAAEVIGYVQCPNASSDSGCTLWVVAQLPWSPGTGWWAISAPDSMGLAGNWTNVSGTILGSGGGNEAIFTKTQAQNMLRAYSCYTSPTSATGYVPTACPNPSPLNFFARYFELTASPANYYPTGESSNLAGGPITISCGDYDCWMSYNSSAP
jgi:hypothetical protein